MDKKNTVSTKLGIGCIIQDNGKILLGKRLNSHDDRTWSFAGENKPVASFLKWKQRNESN